MGGTLFRYIFKDLARVFLLAAVVLAGVLSFAGLLRPLGEQGLGTAQAVRILLWLMPSMLVYSLPVAALFATSFVYGRLAADNESTAAKAAGVAISPFGLLLPALVLGGLLGLTTVGLLSIVVPAANLQVEQTIWGNLARLVASQIDRTSRATFIGEGGRVTVYAADALLPDDATVAGLVERARAGGNGEVAPSDDVQVVRLDDAAVIRYRENKDENGDDLLPRVPEEIYSAAAATIFIDPPGYLRSGAGDAFDQSVLEREDFVISVVLEAGSKFPRSVAVAGPNAAQDGETPAETPAEAVDAPAPLVAAASAAQFGPIRREVPLRTNPKFMAVGELRELLAHPERARRISSIVDRQARLDQRIAYLRRFDERAAGGGITLDASTPDGRRDFRFDADLPAHLASDGVALDYTGIPVRLRQITRDADGEPETLTIESDRARVSSEILLNRGDDARPDGEVLLIFSFADATVTVGDRTTAGRGVERRVRVPMPDDLADIADLTAEDYLLGRNVELGGIAMLDSSRYYLLDKLAGQQAEVIAELHARAAFVVACTFLPLLGGGLGLLFKSGNFLTAFAVSTLPAALCIAFILLGQGVTEELPKAGELALANRSLLRPNPAGIGLIWTGNVLVAVGGGTLLWRLRQR